MSTLARYLGISNQPWPPPSCSWGSRANAKVSNNSPNGFISVPKTLSFSSCHCVRIPTSNYVAIRGVFARKQPCYGTQVSLDTYREGEYAAKPTSLPSHSTTSCGIPSGTS